MKKSLSYLARLSGKRTRNMQDWKGASRRKFFEFIADLNRSKGVLS